MKITLKAEVKKFTNSSEFSTVIVKTYCKERGYAAQLDSRGMITVPAKNAEKIAELINEQP